jgi:hypothetical protein
MKRHDARSGRRCTWCALTRRAWATSTRWAQERGVDYLDGAIMATPSQIGRPDTPIFVSGAATAFRRSERVHKTLAGNLMYLGELVGAASAWDLATLSCLFGAMLGFFHGARIFESEDLRVGDLGAMIADIAPVLGEASIRGPATWPP